jgi:hypothetical protein
MDVGNTYVLHLPCKLSGRTDMVMKGSNRAESGGTYNRKKKNETSVLMFELYHI